MEEHRAIPPGYMRIGEIAKKAGVTVRTLKYYAEEGLLPPSAESDGGYRLYTDKDMVRLIQILMLKQLGLTIGEIKKRLTHLDTPEDVKNMLAEQVSQVRKKMEVLANSLHAMESLHEEITQMKTVNFKKYADILLNVQMNNECYWMIKHFDDDALALFQEKIGHEKTASITVRLNNLLTEANALLARHVLPQSEAAQQYAAKLMATLTELSGGDHDMMLLLTQQIDKASSHNESFDAERADARQFMQNILEIYNKGVQP